MNLMRLRRNGCEGNNQVRVPSKRCGGEAGVGKGNDLIFIFCGVKWQIQGISHFT